MISLTYLINFNKKLRWRTVPPPQKINQPTNQPIGSFKITSNKKYKSLIFTKFLGLRAAQTGRRCDLRKSRQNRTRL
ncbi:hypothetical protein CXB77_06095 (plasmid) [Chromatium okenii]|uniref:Uncharacterized protein n=1 Tax=Chromatium okenii TaxID=61644 RepID=A0A2S7XTL4_9GAMM|nr:hypothetical protein CXB77_06095 [Chromatium okenii]